MQCPNEQATAHEEEFANSCAFVARFHPTTLGKNVTMEMATIAWAVV
jgi:hypothetical protein